MGGTAPAWSPGDRLIAFFDERHRLSVVPAGGGAPLMRIAGETSCFVGSCVIDQLLLGSDGASAVHTTNRGNQLNGTACTCTVEQIQASDSTSYLARTLDTVTQPDGSPPALTNLALTGDILTWEHDGTPRSGQLQP